MTKVTTFRLTAETLADIDIMAAQEGISKADVIRLSVAERRVRTTGLVPASSLTPPPVAEAATDDDDGPPEPPGVAEDDTAAPDVATIERAVGVAPDVQAQAMPASLADVRRAIAEARATPPASAVTPGGAAEGRSPLASGAGVSAPLPSGAQPRPAYGPVQSLRRTPIAIPDLPTVHRSVNPVTEARLVRQGEGAPPPASTVGGVGVSGGGDPSGSGAQVDSGLPSASIVAQSDPSTHNVQASGSQAGGGPLRVLRPVSIVIPELSAVHRGLNPVAAARMARFHPHQQGE